MKPKSRRNTVFVAVLSAALLVAAVAVAEDVWIKSETVQIRSGKGAVFPVIATVQKGTQLTVVAHEGKWLRVKVGDQAGYVYENAISTEKVGGGGNLLSDMGAGAEATNMSTGAAGKGLAAEADDWARDKNLDPGPMNRLIAFRKSIDPKQWQAFTAEGKVGPDAPGAP